MIWIQDKDEQIIYPAKIITKKTFDEFEMCDANQINCLEYLFDPNSIQRNVGGSDKVKFAMSLT